MESQEPTMESPAESSPVEPPAHLRHSRNERGFKLMPMLSAVRGYQGDVTIYESSGGVPAIWLNVNDGSPHISTILLDLDTVEQLEQQLAWLRLHHWNRGHTAHIGSQHEVYIISPEVGL